MTNSLRTAFLYLSEPDMISAGVTDMASCVDTMEEMFALLAAGDYRMAGHNNDSHGSMVTFPDDSPIPTMPRNADDRRFMAMPAYLGGSFGTTGVKWYGSNTENRRRGLPRSIHLFTLNDTTTGAPLAVMSANLLSAYRTGAIPGVGARHLAPVGATTVGIVGPGVMARTSLAAFVAVRPSISAVRVLGRSTAGVEGFVEHVRSTYPQITSITVAESLEDVCAGADIVTYCATGGSDPAEYLEVKRDWITPGALLSMPSYARLDPGLEEPDVRKVVDKLGLYEAWSDEYPYPVFDHIGMVGCRFVDLITDGVLPREEVVEIADVVTGAAVGRESDEQIVVFSVGGMPVEDVAWGTTVYRRALSEGIGTELLLWDTPELA